MQRMESSGLDVEFVTIIVSDSGRRRPSQATAKTWANKYGLNPDLVVADVSGQFSREWNVSSIPLNVLISANGKVVYKQVGSHRSADIERIIAEQL